MSINIEETPNPNTLRFCLDQMFNQNPSTYFANDKEAKGHEFVESLFLIDGVKSVFLGSHFVAITKSEKSTWDQLKSELILCIMHYIASGKDIFKQHTNTTSSNLDESFDPNDPTIKTINDLIEEKIRPALMQDGGSVVFKNFKNGIVYLKLQGACSGCPSSTSTLKGGIKELLQYYVPEVQDVEEVTETENWH